MLYICIGWLLSPDGIRVMTLSHTFTHFHTLQHTATKIESVVKLSHTFTLQHTATPCNISQYTATHCNALQHTATHCNTLQRKLKVSWHFHTLSVSDDDTFTWCYIYVLDDYSLQMVYVSWHFHTPSVSETFHVSDTSDDVSKTFLYRIMTLSHTLIERNPPPLPGGVSYLLCSLIKNRV